MGSSNTQNPVRAVRIHCEDNVATLLDDAPPGPISIVGENPLETQAVQPVSSGHKIALTNIAAGQAVIKYGLPIGHALQDIACGEWVHLHNLASNYDERSSSLDVETGAPTDTGHAYR